MDRGVIFRSAKAFDQKYKSRYYYEKLGIQQWRRQTQVDQI